MATELLTCIKNALSSLNKERGGDRDFEKLCENLISRFIDSNFIPSSGSDSGGDGGIDGWSVFGENNAIKYAFSIDQKTKKKILAEITNCIYNNIRFFSNQEISQKIQEDIKKQFPEKNICFYDKNAIAELIERNEDFGKYIGLKDKQHELDIAYIKGHRQFILQKDTILLPRSVCYRNRNGDTQTELLSKYVEKGEKFTILHAQAGFGKTESLKYIYENILDGNIKGVYPPIFISLSNYTGNNFSELLNNAQNNFSIKDCILLLDGFDEMPYTCRESFIKELKAFVLSNDSYERNVILSSRTYFYNRNVFSYFNPVEVELSPLNDENITEYVKSEIEDTKQPELLKNNFFNSFKYNVFYLVRIVEYYKKQGNTVDSIPNLFEYLCKKEISLFTRNDEVPETQFAGLESIALYMILNQMSSIEDKSILTEVGLNNLPKLTFSHKTIMEYLAAKKICKQNDINNIKNLLYSNNRVVPYLINVFGFVLNICLNGSSEYKIFENLIEYQLKTRDSLSLLKIERDKLTTNINYRIVESILENSNSMTDFRDYVKEISDFFVSGDIEKNLDLLISIMENYENKEMQFTSYLTLNLVINYIDKINKLFQSRIYKLFKKLLDNSDNYTLIESLFFSVCHLPICKEYANDYNEISQKLMNIVYKQNKFYDLVDCLTSYTESCEIIITPEQYYKIYSLLIHILKTEETVGVETVGNQINKNDTSTYHHIIFFISFIRFSDKYFEKYPEYLWQILELISKEDTVSIDSNSELREYYGMLSKHISKFLLDENITAFKYSIVLDLLLKSPSAFDNHYLWNEFNKGVPFINGVKVVEDVLIKTNANFMYYHFLINYCLICIKTEEDFDLFYKFFVTEGNKITQCFFEDYYYRINENDNLFAYISSKMDVKIKEEREKLKKESAKYSINFQERHLLKAKEDFHIIFNKEKIETEVNDFFNEVGNKTEVSEDMFFEYTKDDYNNPDKPMINEFILYWFRLIFRSKDIVTKTKIINMLQSDAWEYNWLINLIMFMNSHNIGFDDCSGEEIKKIKGWVTFVLDKYPLKDTTAKLYQIHRFLSYVLRKTDFLSKDKDFCAKYSETLYGLIFSGFSNVIDGVWYNDYAYYSIEYLEKYLSKQQIKKFIIDNLPVVNLDSDKVIAVYGYLAENKNNISIPQKQVALEIIVEYLRSNLLEYAKKNIIEYAYQIGFRITKIPVQELEAALVLSENKDTLATNYACSLMFEHKFIDDFEIMYVRNAIKDRFTTTKDILLKKILAEYEISINKSAGEIFVFYVDYLLNKQNQPQISTAFYHSMMCTEQIEHLPKIEQIFDYIKDENLGWENQFCYYLNNIVMNSYRAIAKKVNVEDYKRLVKSIEKCTEKIPYYASLLEQIRNDFSQRMYIPCDIEIIKKLQ